MSFVINSDERSVPWYSKNEFFEVFSWLIDSELNSKYLALSRIKIWEERGHGVTKQCPIAVISTSYILYTMLQDRIWDWTSISEGIKYGCLNDNFKILIEKISNGEMMTYQNNITDDETLETCYPGTFSSQNQYCMTIIRIINLFVDQCQSQFFARSISSISAELKIPQILVEIRHQATHGSELPSLEVCRVGGILIFFYLITNYWKNQYNYLSQSITVFNESICEYFNELLSLLSIMHFDWNAHNLLDESLQRENETLVDSFNKYNEIYHSSLSKVIFEHISTDIPLRNKILKYFQQKSKTIIKSERKVANKMIKILTDFEQFNDDSKVKLSKLKKWINKCYSKLPSFYRIIEKIVTIVNKNEADEMVLKEFIFNGLINDICPLCCPASEIVVIFLLKLVSSNIKIEILSKLMTTMFDNLSRNTFSKQNESKIFKKCKQARKIRLFYWLKVLLPDINATRDDKSPNNKENHFKSNKRVVEVILLLTFYKRLEKFNNSKRLMNYEQVIEVLNSTKYSMLILFSELVISIPNLIIKNKTKLDHFSSSTVHLLSDLKIFDSTSKLLYILLKRNQGLNLNHVELFKQFLNIGENYSLNYEQNIRKSNNRGVIIEEFGITPFLKIGTSWDTNNLKIIDHIYAFQNSNCTEEFNKVYSDITDANSDEVKDDIHLTDNVIYENDSIKHLKTITLGMEFNHYSGDQNNPMNTCLLNAEAFMRKNVGIKEIMNEQAINIDWAKVNHLFESRDL